MSTGNAEATSAPSFPPLRTFPFLGENTPLGPETCHFSGFVVVCVVWRSLFPLAILWDEMERIADNYYKAAVVALVVLSAYLGARLMSALTARALWLPKAQAVRVERERAPRSQPDRQTDFQVVQERNLFNDNPPPPGSDAKSAGQAAVPQAPPPPPFEYQLVATCIIDDGKAFAIFTRGEEMLFARKGREVVQGALLSEVKKDRVTIVQGKEKKEILLFPDKKETPGRTPNTQRTYYTPPPPPAQAAGQQSDTIKQIDQNSWAVDKRELDQAMLNLNQLVTQIRVVPNIVDGQTQGFTVFNIAPGSLFTKIGLMDGDIITSVNGTALTGIDVAYQALRNLQNQTNLQVNALRKGQTLTLSYEIR